jgi:tubulin polyglutamylase TTLL6/13
MQSLARKNQLARNLCKMVKQFPVEYDFFPKTWVLPYEFNDLKIFMNGGATGGI